MKQISTTAEMHAVRRSLSGTVGLAPTMGYLHAGHVALVKAARAENEHVIATIFVNPTQFGPNEDLTAYPRDFPRDFALLAEAGCDIVFTPSPDAIYPPGFQTYVTVEEVAQPLEGARRPGHFRGVATVVMKLFSIVQPQAALFGKKDYQQFMVLSAMVREFGMPIEVIPGETVRAPDGLALSSRNGYLTEAERAEAPRLYRELNRIREFLKQGEQDIFRLENAAVAVLTAAGWHTDYVAVRRQADLSAPQAIGVPLVVLAASRLGSTRLIDNIEI